MKKKIFALLLTFALCLIPVIGCFDASAAGRYVNDKAGVLSASEADALESRLSALSSETGMSVAVYTVPSLTGSSVQAEADDTYDSLYGVNSDGIMFFMAMDSRDWQISTSGKGIKVLYDNAIKNTFDAMYDELSAGNYSGAFGTYANRVESYYNSYLEDQDDSPKFGVVGIVSVIAGALSGLIRGSVLKSELKSVAAKTEANDYVKSGSFKLTSSRDVFLYRKVERTKRAAADDSDKTSTTHTSSSGGTHGGAGGKF